MTYQRRYMRGLVVVNPSEGAARVGLDAVYQLGVPSGGGPVSSDGTPSGSLAFEAVDALDLAPHTAAIVLTSSAAR